MKIITLVAAAMGAALLAGRGSAAPADGGHSVLELRQYKIVAGKRDAFVDYFEQYFVESQEELGMRLVGQFRDRDDPSRFVWLRAFASMDVRGKALNDFYFGPVWQAHRDVANPMLDDNDDVLLLKPAWDGSEVSAPQSKRPPPGAPAAAAGTVVITIEHLWKDPAESYAAHFRDALAPAYRAAGLPVLGAYVAENQTNNFPRLYVRQNERVFVWITRVASPQAYAAAMRKLVTGSAWRDKLAGAQQNYLERPPQILMLDPTPRSLLR